MNNKPILEATEQDTGQRVDNFILKKRKQLDRASCYKLIRKGQVRVNGKRCKPMLKLAAGDQVRIPPHVFFVGTDKPAVSMDAQADLLKRVVYEDDDFLIIDKPAGMPVHAGSEHPVGLIEIMQSVPAWENAQLAHRLDRNTSGCLVLSRHRQALLAFQNMLKNHEIEKTYLAVLSGNLTEPCVVDLPLDVSHREQGIRTVKIDPEHGKAAQTSFEPVQGNGVVTLVRCQIKWGRTHQIRVHAQSLDMPVLGDWLYGKNDHKSRRSLYLHAQKLVFGDVSVETTVPSEFLALV